MTRHRAMQALAERALEEIDKDFGYYPGYRAAQAKGTLCRGTFTSTGLAAEHTTAAHLQPNATTPVTARFANSATNPMRPDGHLDVRGMSTAFHLPGGRRTDIVALRMSVFLVGTANEFLRFERAIRRPLFGGLPWPTIWSVIYPARGRLPLTLGFRQLRPLCRVASYAGSRYNSLHAFKWMNEGDEPSYVRYSWVPEVAEEKLHWWQTRRRDPDYLRAELADRLARAPIRFRLQVQIAAGDDRIADASSKWPASRERMEVGTLELTELGGWDTNGEQLRFDPTRLTDGIELPEGDTLLELRRRVYALSAERRRRAGNGDGRQPEGSPAPSAETPRWVPVNGNIQICYERIGPMTGRPLLLIMGFACSQIWWQPRFCQDLVARGFHLIRFDNRDCGRSTHLGVKGGKLRGLIFPRWRPPYTVHTMASDTAELLKAIGLGPVHVMGISMGGMIAQALTIEHPELVRSLTCVASAPRFRLWPPWPPKRIRLLRALAKRPPKDENAYVGHSVPVWRLLNAGNFLFEEQNVRSLLHTAFQWSRGPDPDADFRQTVALRASKDRTAGLRKVRKPALVIHGTDDPLVPYSGGIATARAIEHAEFIRIPGMGHYTPMQTWKTVIDGVDEVARKADTSGTPG